jgi:hypothetical protein
MDSIIDYPEEFSANHKAVCQKIQGIINSRLTKSDSKLYHGAPVWFIAGNPIVGYSLKRDKIALLFWSGASFKRPGLVAIGKYKAAEISYGNLAEINEIDLLSWLEEAESVIWDYKNLRNKNGVLERLK